MTPETMVRETMARAEFPQLDAQDFGVFGVPGFEARMDALRTRLRPKLEQIGAWLTPVLSDALDRPFFAHVARHARRKVNAPNDSWVAFSENARGYKQWPMFMVGLWQTHLFVQFGVIYESPRKAGFARHVIDEAGRIKRELPSTFVVHADYTAPEGVALGDLSEGDLQALAHRAAERKQGDLLFGLQIPREQAVSRTQTAQMVRASCLTLASLYPSVR